MNVLYDAQSYKYFCLKSKTLNALIGNTSDKDMPKYQIMDKQEGYSIIHIDCNNHVDIQTFRI